MRKNQHENRYENGRSMKNTRFPASLFAIYLIVLLLMTGIHTGLILLSNAEGWSEAVQTIIPIVYWTIVAIVLTLFTRKRIRSTYEKPMQELAKATRQVAEGDFSVYVPTLHTADRLDYLDEMILDFNKMVEELGSVETLKTDFISNVSHEMKTPIAIIKNYAELLQSDHIPDEQRKEYAHSIEEASVRLSNLISNILKLNKLEHQSITPDAARYDVCRQLCDCILQFEDVWEKKEIEMEINLEDFAFIEADESLLELVWNNLLSNALKFTEPNGTVTVTQVSDEKNVTISVADSGCGMEQTSLQHIFDKFYQGDTSHSKEGNGLGLALAKRVLELSNGDIHVTSTPGEGSTFTVTLPAAKSQKDQGERA